MTGGYQDLIDWCNSAALPKNRQTAVSVNLYQAPAPGQPAEAAWVGTLTPTPPSSPNSFELDGSLQPLKPQYGEVQLHIVIDLGNPTNEHASATLQGNHIKPEWQNENPVLVYNNTPDYHGDGVISGKVEIVTGPASAGSTLYPIILGPSYTYHPPTP
jgi:hypothetical protein